MAATFKYIKKILVTISKGPRKGQKEIRYFYPGEKILAGPLAPTMKKLSKGKISELTKQYDKLGADIIGLQHGGGGVRTMLRLVDRRREVAKSLRSAGVKLGTKKTITTKAGSVAVRK
jgi:hypothetical protein